MPKTRAITCYNEIRWKMNEHHMSIIFYCWQDHLCHHFFDRTLLEILVALGRVVLFKETRAEIASTLGVWGYILHTYTATRKDHTHVHIV